MSGPRLFELAAEFRALGNQLHDLDLPPEVITDTLEGEAAALDDKVVAVAMVIRNLDATAAAIKEAEASMAARRKAVENRASQLRDYLLHNMLAAERPKVSSPYLTVTVRENAPSVVIDDMSLLPPELVRTRPAPPPEPDKVAIAAAFRDGLDVPGAHPVRSVSLLIR